MKYFAFIMSVYMAFLTVMPCQDAMSANSGKSEASAIFISHTDDHSHGPDTCSPFCSCSCCSTVFDVQPPLIFELKSFEKKPATAIVYTESFYSHDFHSIWQPPKIG